MTFLNRLSNSSNKYQGDRPKILCCCSAGLLRSPTAAALLSSEPYNYNTRAVGIATEYALIPIDSVLVNWADYIVVMDQGQKDLVEGMIEDNQFIEDKSVLNLDIPDNYRYMDPELVKELKAAFERIGL